MALDVKVCGINCTATYFSEGAKTVKIPGLTTREGDKAAWGDGRLSNERVKNSRGLCRLPLTAPRALLYTFL